MDNVQIQDDLRNCEIVRERKLATHGPGDWFFLKLGNRVVPLGDDDEFAAALMFALRRNAVAFDHSGR